MAVSVQPPSHSHRQVSALEHLPSRLDRMDSITHHHTAVTPIAPEVRPTQTLGPVGLVSGAPRIRIRTRLRSLQGYPRPSASRRPALTQIRVAHSVLSTAHRATRGVKVRRHTLLHHLVVGIGRHHKMGQVVSPLSGEAPVSVGNMGASPRIPLDLATRQRRRSNIRLVMKARPPQVIIRRLQSRC